ncbi:ATP-binding cassette domain-containing protein [Janthinobacterium agaricidamnosum]|uniref:ABC transporter family protein n=1 Tax=Janthinobacterium agaricidamnosum NBRC 102515 = DSM 9628 TaxID=1349767 RepID=W0UWZ1_9BURK|nr:ATP-binding cassette domain-containing protein [Janthinobacterium agaricidamnosum]CDG80979.1 ABC transporter family protein [Janthinobacterium agaricidamnosum NBRC 102515 = DSM 9628]
MSARMSTLLQLDRISCILPDGRTLFHDLQHSFKPRRIGLVGANGTGKTLLGRLLAGLDRPASGAVRRAGSVYYVAQHLDPLRFPSVAALAGVDAVLAALARIAAGSVDAAAADYALMADDWDAPARLMGSLAGIGLGHLAPDTASGQLSGGERQRIALMGAWLSHADWLILDEPSNHLDASQRQQLCGQIRRWPHGLILISHDRGLLEHVDEIVELSAHGLTAYGGNYHVYQQQRSAEQAAFQATLHAEKAGARRQRREQDAQLERQMRRKAGGDRGARDANLSKLMLGLRKDQSENTLGKLRQHAEQAREHSRQRVADARQRCAPEWERLLLAPGGMVPNGKMVLELRELVLPYGQYEPLNLTIKGPLRLAVGGDNGSGKSTLLRIIAGQLQARSGEVIRHGHLAWLDQHAGLLQAGQSALQRVQQRNALLSEGEIRTRLVLLGIDAARVNMPSGQLSGGERLKVALAAELYAERPPQLLLLDEPDNHLDLASLAALEQMLSQYQGALMVVSHDAAFLSKLNLDTTSLKLQKNTVMPPLFTKY